MYRVRPNRGAHGHEQQGVRFGVAVQPEYLHLSTVIIVPTSTSSTETPFRPQITVNGQPTRALAEQVQAVDWGRLGDHIGRLDPEDLAAVQEALQKVLGLW